MSIDFFAKSHDANWSWAESELSAFTFPGGEPHIKGVDSPKQKAQLAYVRGADSHDLITLAMWADAVHERGESALLALPYLPGARADRGVPFGAGFYANFINGLQVDAVAAIDPHSPVMPNILYSLKVVPVEAVIRHFLGARGDMYDHPYVGVIAPDKGAAERAAKAAAALRVPLFIAGKKRDFETGKLSGFECEPLPTEGKLLIVDDICDGGGTFIGLADHIAEEQGITLDRLHLWVTHGIFSKGFVELGKRFETIHTTDSWSTLKDQPAFIQQHSIGLYMLGALNNA